MGGEPFRKMDNSEIAKKIGKNFDATHDQRLAEAERRQAKIAKGNHQKRKAIDGLGAPVMEIDTQTQGTVEAQYGKGCFRDPDFRKWYQKRNPNTRVGSSGTKVMVGYGS